MTGRHRSCSVCKDLLSSKSNPIQASALVQRDDAQVESSLKLRWLCGPDHQGEGGGRVHFLVDSIGSTVVPEPFTDKMRKPPSSSEKE